MFTTSVALAPLFSATLSLSNIDTTGPVTIGFSRGLTAQDTFILWGTMDSAAIDSSNAETLGFVTGASIGPLLSNLWNQARTWPCLLLQRTGGGTAGTFYVTGNVATNPAAVSVAAPSASEFSTILNLTAFSANGVRIGGSRELRASDIFDIYLSQDAAATSASGATLAGRITSGGGSAISILTYGWPYALAQRISGSTAGSIIAAGAASGLSSAIITPVGQQQFWFYDQYGAETSLLTIADNAASQTFPADLLQLRVMSMVFPAGWLGGNIIVSGLDRVGGAQTEIFVSPGPAGGRVDGVKVFSALQTAPTPSFTNTAPGGVGATSVSVEIANRICVPTAPVYAFDYVYIGASGLLTSQPGFASVDLVNGWCQPAGVVLGIGSAWSVGYRIRPAIVLS